MPHLKKIWLLLLITIILYPTGASAEEKQGGYDLGLGAGVKVSTSEYKGEETTISPIPIVNFESEYVFVHGLTAGAYIYADETSNLLVTVSYLAHNYDASENDEHAMKRLKDRYSTMMLGAAYELHGSWGTADISLAADVLDTNNGFTADASYAYPFKAAFLKIKPFIGVEWTSERYNDYYYGVSASESRKSGLMEYEAEGGFSPYVGVGLKVDLTNNLEMGLNTKIKQLSDEITDSSMVDRDVNYSCALGFSYSF